jgi:hypothetical protein
MTFEGFAVPQKNYFPMPNIWINICAHIDNLAELKVVQYVLRHTWGYHEYGIPKTISVDEFMYGRKRADGSRIDDGTGLKSDRSVKDGIKAALDHGYLICEVDDTDKGRIKKSYALKMAPGEGYNLPPDENRGVDTTPQTGSNHPSGSQNPPPRGPKTTPRSEKDTLEKHSDKTPGKDMCVGDGESPSEGTPTPEKPPQKISFLTLLDHWDKQHGASPRPKWVMNEAKDLADRMKATPEQMDKVCTELKKRKKPLTFETMYNHWHLLQAKPPGDDQGQPPDPGVPTTNLVALAAAQQAQRQRGVSA